MRTPSIGPLIAVILCIATALALLGAAEVETPSHPNSGTASSRSTVRTYFAALETYFRTGDLSGASSQVSADVNSRLEWRLRALHANYPQLSIDVVEMLADGERVTAEIIVDAGMDTRRFPVQPGNHLSTWRAWETFRVQENLVTEHSVVGPGLGLFAPQGNLSVERHPAGGMTLHTARLTFPRGIHSYVALPAPVMVTVESGVIEVQGDGVTSLVPIDGGFPELLEPVQSVQADSGETLTTRNARLVMRNTGESRATLIVAMLAPSLSRPPAEMEHLEYRSGPGLDPLADSGVIVDSLGSLQLPEEPIDEMLGGWIVLDPGGSAFLHHSSAASQLIPLTGNPLVEWNMPGSQSVISNPGTEQIVVWAVFII